MACIYRDVCPRPCGYNIIFPQVLRDMPSFSFHARYALLTYAQCDGLDPWDIVSHFTSLEAECIVGRESHADGGTHYHAFADFGRKRKFRRHDTFDVRGFHANITPSRGTPEIGWDYATKDGDVVAGGLERPCERSRLAGDVSKFHQIIECESEPEFWETVRRLAPELLLRNFQSLKSYAASRYASAPIRYSHPVGVRFAGSSLQDLDEWRERNLEVHRRGEEESGRRYVRLGARGSRPTLRSSGGPALALLPGVKDRDLGCIRVRVICMLT